VKKLFTPHPELKNFLRNLFGIQILFVTIFTSVADSVDLNKAAKFSISSAQSFGSDIFRGSYEPRKLFGMPSVSKDNVREAKGWLGVVLKEVEPVKNLGEIKIKFPSASIIPALEVAGVFPYSSAANAGLLVGDKILAVDDELISKTSLYSLKEKFSHQIASKNIGKDICLHILRNQKMRKLFVPVLPRPRAKTKDKIHLELDQAEEKNIESFLYQVLKKGNLLEEYNRTASEISGRTSDVISYSLDGGKFNPFRLKEVNYILNNPMDLPLVSNKIVASLKEEFSQNYSSFVGLIIESMDGLDIELLKNEPENESILSVAEVLEAMMSALAEASKARVEALSNLTFKDIDNLYRSFSTIDLNNISKKEMEQIMEFAQKVDLPKLLKASIGIARILDCQLAKNRLSLEDYEFSLDWNVDRQANLIRIQTPDGKIFIGGEGNNVYREDALLIIDLGGDDIYLNNSGGSTKEFPFSVLLDFSGNDLYMSPQNISQGSGFLGGGFLIDYAGNDRYISKMYSQGSGFMGIGVLADFGGHDEYSCKAYCQASGIFGIGLLAEASGNDKYFADIFSQGVGLTQGYGALIEAGGDDNYYAGGFIPDHRQPHKAFKSMSQGFGYGIRSDGVESGASGGIGIIADQEGDDTYIGDYFGQGSSYWYALGILSDKEGNDKYMAGRYSQGAGIHQSAGILSDSHGDDEYFVHYGVSQGCGYDLAIGFLLDNSGDDKYSGGVISQGAGNGNGFGVLNDNGGKDEYNFLEPGQGSGHYLPFRNLGSLGVFVDTGGGEDFYHDGDKNNRIIFKNDLGIFADIQ
jgi:hypothetical protein